MASTLTNKLTQMKIDCENVFKLTDAILKHKEYIETPYYQELSYIESTGTQYIDPGVTVDSNYIVETKFLLTGSNKGMGRMFGGGTDMHFEMAASGTGGFRWSINGSGTTVSFTSGTSHIFKCYGNGLCYIDGTQKANLARNQTSTKLWLFDNYAHTEHAIGRLYYCKIWNGNTLVRDFIPVKNLLNNTVCLYDKISKQFFTNLGTGTFGEGSVVT